MSSKVANTLVIGKKDSPTIVQVNGHSKTQQAYSQPTATPLKSSSAVSRGPMSAEELAEKKRLVQERLKEKEKRVSRLSMAMGNARGSTRTQQQVDQMSEKLKKMQAMLKQNENLRAQEEAAELKRSEEDRRLQRLTQELEKAIEPNSMTKSQKDRRTKNMMGLLRQTGGKITEDALESLEKNEREMDEREKRERREKMEATEKRLKEINDKIRNHARARDEQGVQRMQKQLEAMEGKLRNIEGGADGDTGGDDDDDEKEMREWEKQMEKLRKEREEAMRRRKIEMENRLKELQDMVEEKRRARQEQTEARYKRKVAALEQTLQDIGDEPDEPDLPSTPGRPNGRVVAPPVTHNQAEFEAWMQRIVEERIAGLEREVKKKAQADDAQLMKREQELREREKAMEEREAKQNQQLANISNLGNFKDLEALAEKFAKIDLIEKNLRQLEGQVKEAKFSVGNNGGEPTMTAEELMKEIQEAQRIIFDDKSTEKQVAEANINLEKLMEQYEKTPECRAAKEEKRAANEKLNKAAVERVRAALKALSPEQIKQRLTDNPELKLILMEPQAILKLHQNDFKMFAIRGLTLEELRALRGSLPTFRRDQQVQLGWVDSMEGKIEELAANGGDKPAPPKPVQKKPAKKLNMKKAGAGAASGGDIFAQILARGKKLVGAGGDDDDSSSAPAAPPAPNVALATNAPPPPMLAKGPRPPLPPPGPPGPPPPQNNAPIAVNAPPPPAIKATPPPAPVASKPPTPAPAASKPPTPAPAPTPPPQAKAEEKSFIGNARASRMLQPLQNLPTEDEVKTEVDALVNLVFAGGTESEVVTKCKIVSEQIKVLAGEHKELAPKARFLIMAVKEAMVSRNGAASEAAHARQKLLVVVNSFKRALVD